MTYCHKLGSGGWCQSTAPCLPGECKYRSAYTILSTNNPAQSGAPSESPSDFITRQVAEVERLTAENAALRKDAERYRWLRTQHANILRGPVHVAGVGALTSTGLDAAIDAHLAREEKP